MLRLARPRSTVARLILSYMRPPAMRALKLELAPDITELLLAPLPPDETRWIIVLLTPLTELSVKCMCAAKSAANGFSFMTPLENFDWATG